MKNLNINFSDKYQVPLFGKDDLFTLCMVFIAIILRMASTPTANLSYIFIAIYALLGRAPAIRALALSWVFTMINTGIVPDANYGTIGRYVVIAAAALSVMLQNFDYKQGMINGLSFLTWIISGFLLIHSLMFSSIIDVSILKVLSWSVVILTLLSAWQGLTNLERLKLFNQLQGALIMIILLSVPFLIIPNIGYQRNETGFQGLLNHPQAFGPMVALVGALIGGRILGERKPLWRDIAMLGFCVVLVVLSEARTAGLAMVGGLICTVFLSPLFADLSRKKILPGLSSRRVQAAGMVGVAAIFVAGPFFTSYLYKRTDATSLIEAADASRGFLVQMMFENIVEKPLTGIGFGIASDPASMEIERDPLIGLPLGAPIEKGVMPLAVLEELGVFGAVLVLFWIIAVIRRGARAGAPQFAVLMTLLLVNLGESMFFSVGGMGMLLLIMLTGAVTSAENLKVKVDHV
jgi:hypothetical protein